MMTLAGGWWERWTRIPRFLPSGRPAMLHIFRPVEDGQTLVPISFTV